MPKEEYSENIKIYETAVETAERMKILASLASSLISSTREQVYLRKEDGLLILRPNKMYFVNKTARNILEKLYSPEYHAVCGEKKNHVNIDLERLIAETASQYKIGKSRLADDIEKLLQTLLSLVSSQNSVPYVDRYPTPALKLTNFASHDIYYPVLSEIAMTYRCQLKCKFCYAGVGMKSGRAAGGPEMTIGEIKAVIKKIFEEAHCPTISFTGGEPTTRFDELSDAISYAKSLGMRTNLITNGLILSEAGKCERLRECGLDSAQVSVEGADAGTHDMITGMTGSFEKTFAAVKNLKAAGIHVHTNSTITEDNVESINALPEILSKLGLKYFSVNMVIKTGCANANKEISIGYKDIGERIKKLDDIAKGLGIKLVWYSPTPYCLFNPVEAGLGSKSCAAASGLLSVSPSGEVLPCSSFSGSLGNILKKSFESIWSSRAAKYFRNKEFTPPTCKKCGLRDICQGGCPLYWDARGDFSEIEPYGCGKNRMKDAAFKLKRMCVAPKYGI